MSWAPVLPPAPVLSAHPTAQTLVWRVSAQFHQTLRPQQRARALTRQMACTRDLSAAAEALQSRRTGLAHVSSDCWEFLAAPELFSFLTVPPATFRSSMLLHQSRLISALLLTPLRCTQLRTRHTHIHRNGIHRTSYHSPIILRRPPIGRHNLGCYCLLSYIPSSRKPRRNPPQPHGEPSV
jgi:hypothetical protein